MDTQLSLLPLDHPDAVANEADRALRRLRRLAPKLISQECLVVLGELALLQLVLDTVEQTINYRAEWDVKLKRKYRHKRPVRYQTVRQQKLA